MFTIARSSFIGHTEKQPARASSIRRSQDEVLAADYLVVGAGLHTLSFMDELIIQDDDCTIIVIDKHPAPGGHWNVAYPHVTLHQPSACYGVNSMPVTKEPGRNGWEPYVLNDLSSREELLSYFAAVMRKLEATGRVRYFPNSTYDFERRWLVRADGGRRPVCFRKVVVTTSNVSVPAMVPPAYEVAHGTEVLPVNALSTGEEASRRRGAYVVVGGGKTGIDAVLLLLARGMRAEELTWVIPRDAWLLIREGFFRDHVRAVGELLDVLLAVHDGGAVLRALEKKGLAGRLDTSTEPSITRAAMVTTSELAQLRTLHDAGRIVRLGRVRAIDQRALSLERGEWPMPSAADALVIDASANGIDAYESVETPFEPERIRLVACMGYNVSFAGAAQAYIEAHVRAGARGATDDEAKNAMLFHWADGKSGVQQHLSNGFVALFYGMMKTTLIMQELRGGTAWVFHSRTNYLSTKHNSALSIIHAICFKSFLGKAKRFIKKVETGGFEDLTPCEHWIELWREEAKVRGTSKRLRPLVQCLAGCLLPTAHSEPTVKCATGRVAAETVCMGK